MKTMHQNKNGILTLNNVNSQPKQNVNSQLEAKVGIQNSYLEPAVEVQESRYG